jgi:hypothetical protein
MIDALHSLAICLGSAKRLAGLVNGLFRAAAIYCNSRHCSRAKLPTPGKNTTREEGENLDPAPEEVLRG